VDHCPNCGGTAKTVYLEALSSIQVKSRVQGIWRGINVFKEWSWKAISILAIVNFVAMVPAYYLSGWWSVVATVVFSLLSAIVGYFAVTKVREISKGQFGDSF
jgi:hypothetical protein